MIDATWVQRYVNHETVRWLDEGDQLVHEGRPDQVYRELTAVELDEWAAEFRDGTRTVFATPRHFLKGLALGRSEGFGVATEEPITCLACLACSR